MADYCARAAVSKREEAGSSTTSRGPPPSSSVSASVGRRGAPSRRQISSRAKGKEVDDNVVDIGRKRKHAQFMIEYSVPGSGSKKKKDTVSLNSADVHSLMAEATGNPNFSTNAALIKEVHATLNSEKFGFPLSAEIEGLGLTTNKVGFFAQDGSKKSTGDIAAAPHTTTTKVIYRPTRAESQAISKSAPAQALWNDDSLTNMEKSDDDTGFTAHVHHPVWERMSKKPADFGAILLKSETQDKGLHVRVEDVNAFTKIRRDILKESENLSKHRKDLGAMAITFRHALGASFGSLPTHVDGASEEVQADHMSGNHVAYLTLDVFFHDDTDAE